MKRFLLTAAIVCGSMCSFAGVHFGLMPVPDHPLKTKYISITIDDGPAEGFYDAIRPVLLEQNAKVTFFMVGRNILRNGGCIKSIIADGNEIGNHTWNHLVLSHQSAKTIRREFKTTRTLIEKVTGLPCPLVRYPYREFNYSVSFIAHEMRLTPAFWTIDTYDWRGKTANEIANMVIREARPGSVVLLHERIETRKAIPRIVRALSKRGYQLVTYSELKGLNSSASYIKKQSKERITAHLH